MRQGKAVEAVLKSMLGDRNVMNKDISKYTTDWQGQYGGKGSLVIFPRSTDDVSKALKYCDNNGLKVVPQSGNTSLVAGSVPVDTELVLSFEKMNKIESFDEISGVVRCQVGVILQDLQKYLGEKGFVSPYDLGARGSCMVGGNLSTMAAGIHFVKYGSLRNYVLGIEAVLANGDILDMMQTVRKDNTGPDLKQLFIGSEGTLGVITEANILCPKKDKYSKLVFLKTKDYENVLKIHSEARGFLKKSLNAIEYLDLGSYSIVESHQPTLKFPYESKHCDKDSYFMLIEISGEKEADLETTLMDFCMKIDKLTDDILTCQSLADERNFWEIRERVAESCVKSGDVLKYDLSIDISLNDELLKYTRQLLGDKASLVSGYAHIGDGNIHMNIVVNPKYDWKQVKQDCEPHIMAFVVKHRGSISAEHGIGYVKAHYMDLQKGKLVMDSMRKLKKLYDPNFTLNPGKIFEL